MIEAETAVEGLRLAAARHPHLILLDIGLPDLSGYEVCKKLKSDSATLAIPITWYWAPVLLGCALSVLACAAIALAHGGRALRARA